MIRTIPDTRGRGRYRDEPPAPRQRITYRCDRGHDFTLTFAAGAEPPQAADCRCGGQGQRDPDQGRDHPHTARQAEHERRMAQLFERRTLAGLEQLLAERLAEVRSRA
jgi:hypothetical protein